ncbi:hypothetical protein Gpo141_00004308 [Globisporangium polare]
MDMQPAPPAAACAEQSDDAKLLPAASMSTQQPRSHVHTGRWLHCAAYLALQSAFLLALLVRDAAAQSLPAERPVSVQHESSSAVSKREWSALLGLAILTCGTFLLLQGSDPGYLNEEILLEGVFEGGRHDGAQDQVEEHHLLSAVLPSLEVGDDITSCSGEEEDKCARTARLERCYRLERIAQIQKALALEAGGHNDGEFEAASGDVLRDLIAPGKGAEVDAHLDFRRFCAECAILPPLRAHHCRSCGRCVATFDHHCLLLGTCVGERNHARFWWFLLLQSLESALALAIAHSSFEPHSKRSQSWIHVNAASFFLASTLWLIFVFVFGLWVFHTFLALTSSTTFEIGSTVSDELSYLNGFRDCDLPFSRGAIANVAAFCCPERMRTTGGSGDDRRSNEFCCRRTRAWRPTLWQPPQRFERDSERICSHPWENKYWSCC